MTLCKRFRGSIKNNSETVLSLPLTREDKATTELGRILSEKLMEKLQEKSISKTVDKDFSIHLAEELIRNGQSLEDPQTIREAGRFSGSTTVIIGTLHLTGEKFKVTLQLYDSDTARLIKKTNRSLLAGPELVKLYSQEIKIEPPEMKSAIEKTPDFGKLIRDYLSMQNKVVQVSDGKTILKADPSSNQDMAALELLARGHIYFDAQDYFSAVNAYTKALSFNPEIYESYLFRGIAFYKKNAILKALEDFNKCVDVRPKDPVVLILLGLTYIKNNENSRAVQDFSKAISLDPKSGEAYYERGQIQQSREDFITGCNLGWKPACDALKKLKK